MSKIKIIQMKDGKIELQLDNALWKGQYYLGKDFIDLHLPGGNFRIPLSNGKKRSKTQAHEGGLEAPMPGKIVKVLVKEKQTVQKGEILLILEAMKMEHKIVAPHDGKIRKIFYQEGERVSQGEELVEINSL
jgi:biotin carboxyl carrier protein